MELLLFINITPNEVLGVYIKGIDCATETTNL